jgi:hypothetical protein
MGFYSQEYSRKVVNGVERGLTETICRVKRSSAVAKKVVWRRGRLIGHPENCLWLILAIQFLVLVLDVDRDHMP